jgi:hypothetical protein
MTRASLRHRPLIALTGLALVAGCGGGDSGTIGGTVSGLDAGASLVVQNNGGDSLTINANGAFQFATALDTGVSYDVAIAVQPSGESCAVSNGSGTVDSNDDAVDAVSVACTTLLALAGTVSGLAPGTSVTLSNGQILLPVATNGAFAFPGTVTAGAFYNVTVATQPLGETCLIANGSGAVPTAGPPAIVVTCS